MISMPDLINGSFELCAGFFIWNNVRILLKEKQVQGVSILTTGVFMVWGFWNLFYYPYLSQWLSFFGGINVAISNAVWVILALKYSARSSVAEKVTEAHDVNKENPMAKYRKKPVVIEAEQWFKVEYDREAGHGIEPEDFPIYHLDVGYYRTPECDGERACKHCGDIMHNHGWVDTKEGGHIACPRDFIITGVQGELYPCKPDIFAATYELVGDAVEKATEANDV